MERHKDVTFFIETVCNFRCPFCWHDAFRSNIKPVTFGEYKRVLLEDVHTKEYNRVLLSGAEVTLNRDLIKFVEFAKKLEHIKHIRIQTNGSKLSDLDYCKSLIKAGVDEFYVSLYGHNAQLQDELTLVKNSFSKAMAALKNLSTLKATIIVGTVITELNYKYLPEILMIAYSFNPSELYIWNYVCMEEKKEYLIASNIKVRPYLLKALKNVEKMKEDIYIMFYPECLLGDFKGLLDNIAQAKIECDPLFYDMLEKVEIYTCPFRKICPSVECHGIAEFQQRKYGLKGYAPFFKKYLIQEFAAHPEKRHIDKYSFYKDLLKLKGSLLPQKNNEIVQAENY